MIDTMIDDFHCNKIKYIVMAHSLRNSKIYHQLNKEDFHVLEALDSRSAGYMATGIAAEKGQCVVLITENNNDSRNCYSSLTEAYYKKLPILFLTLDTGFSLNYSNELNDAMHKTYIVRNAEEWNPTMVSTCIKSSLPIHIIIPYEMERDMNPININDLRNELLSDDVYIYISNSVEKSSVANGRYNVAGGSDGVVSNVLGASLSGRYKKYVGIATDIEILHDLNSFGNRYMNDAVSFVVYYENKKEIIKDYVLDLGFSVEEGLNNLTQVLNNNKTILFIEGKKYGIQH